MTTNAFTENRERFWAEKRLLALKTVRASTRTMAQADNTRLRQLLKAKGISNELEMLQQKINDLTKRVSTADVLGFTLPAEDELQFKAA